MAKGRPRKIGVKRTKSGQISRAASTYAENADGIALRMRVFGLSEKDARDQRAGTYVGRLCMAGNKNSADGITNAQYDAAQAWRQAYEAFQRAVKSPDALRTGTGGGDQGESEDYARRCKAAISRWNALQAAVQLEQGFHENRGANMWAALDYLVNRDEQHPQMIGDLRLALNAVGHHLGIIPKEKPASVYKNVA
ncbi:hypothetical protein [Devosia beringensis]|uniref:hypothetical protein n=1 Tax=Devosia beringensis TaxID=2657486 RepID=UPI00186B8907|nr:hypothetical protein [Devosia beringensis]